MLLRIHPQSSCVPWAVFHLLLFSTFHLLIFMGEAGATYSTCVEVRDNLQESVLSFHDVGSRAQTQVIQLGTILTDQLTSHVSFTFILTTTSLVDKPQFFSLGCDN